MIKAFKHIGFAATAAMSIAGAGLPGSVSAQQEWQQNLEDEIEAVQDCVIDTLGDALIEEAENEQTITVSVLCKDGRVFVASQAGQFLPFDFELCEGGDLNAC